MSSARSDLESIKSQVDSVVREIDSIAGEVQRSFVGIGNERCATCLYKIADQYRKVRNQLNRINP